MCGGIIDKNGLSQGSSSLGSFFQESFATSLKECLFLTFRVHWKIEHDFVPKPATVKARAAVCESAQKSVVIELMAVLQSMRVSFF